jgi:hypothetical protein
MSDKYIKLKVSEESRTGEDTLVFYEVLETKNINFVEPGYVYGFSRPNTFKKNFEEGTWDGVNIHLVL